MAPPRTRLQDLVLDLQTKILTPGWIANHLPDGVLFHNGWAAQEMPRSEARGGYLHALRDAVKGPAARAFYASAYVPTTSYPGPLPGGGQENPFPPLSGGAHLRFPGGR